MPMQNLIEFSDNYLKTSGSFNNKLAVNNNVVIVDFNVDNVTDLFNSKVIITSQTYHNSTKNVEIMLSLKCLRYFWRTLHMSLINREINLILAWSANCVIFSTAIANQSVTFTITETKLYVPVVTLFTHNNVKLLDQLKSGFKRIISWSKYQNCQWKDKTDI